MISGIPALVITGGWNDEYEVIAGELSACGAMHRVIPGHAHRPQDSEEFGPLARAFEDSLAL
jgi:hypothetical protein